MSKARIQDELTVNLTRIDNDLKRTMDCASRNTGRQEERVKRNQCSKDLMPNLES
jgi:hypothetical protein